ncbi:MAG: DNA methyltransferase, partial [Thermomicrobium sp.]
TSATQVLPSVHYSYAQTAAQRFAALFDGEKVFDNPKPFEDLSRLVDYLTGPDDIILDFFAGSGSTAHGVWTANQSMGTQRRFLVVQLDEPVNPDTTAGKNAVARGLHTIDEVTKERLRRVSRQLKDAGASGDLGFKVFKLAPSNLKAWRNYDGGQLEELTLRIVGLESPLVENWKRDDLLVEVVLREGFPIDSRVEREGAFSENDVWRAVHPLLGTTLLVCLDARVSQATVGRLTDYGQDVFVCLDTALDNQAKLQIMDRLKIKTL